MKILICPIDYITKAQSPWTLVHELADDLRKANHTVAICGNANYRVKGVRSFVTPRNHGCFLARKDVDTTFEEYLYNYQLSTRSYLNDKIAHIRKVIKEFQPDIVYTVYDISAIIAAHLENVMCVGSYSYAIARSRKGRIAHMRDLNKVLTKFKMPQVRSVNDLYEYVELLFVYSDKVLSPLTNPKVVYVGGLRLPYEADDEKNVVICNINPDLVSIRDQIKVMEECFLDGPFDVVIQANRSYTNRNVAARSVAAMDNYLRNAKLYIHSGYDTCLTDALTYRIPQIVIPDLHYYAKYNTQTITRFRLGIELEDDEFDVKHIYEAYRKMTTRERFRKAINERHEDFDSLMGNKAIIAHLEALEVIQNKERDDDDDEVSDRIEPVYPVPVHQ